MLLNLIVGSRRSFLASHGLRRAPSAYVLVASKRTAAAPPKPVPADALEALAAQARSKVAAETMPASATAAKVRIVAPNVTKVTPPITASSAQSPAPAHHHVDEASLSPEEFRKKHQIQIDNHDVNDPAIAPFASFDLTPFDDRILSVFEKAGYTAPTVTQSQSWPIALQGRDMISVAKTGSGKTFAFLAPAISKLLEGKAITRRNRRGTLPKVLVLAPTRELCVQIATEAEKFSQIGLRTVAVYGGASRGVQIRGLRDGADIVVATPGRCNDLLECGALSLRDAHYGVLDEADRMLDMGFEPQIRAILNDLPAEKQLLMFTATWPKGVQNLATTFLKDPVHVTIGDNELHANKAITQNIMVMRNTRGNAKHEVLLNLLKELNTSETKAPNKIPKCIIFVSRKDDCDFFRDMLHDEGYAVDALHGDKSQNYRDIAMSNFRRGSVRILIATDVAARGLDVKDIEVVINYEFPNSGVEDYVHRIGRTARGDRTGVSYTFFGEADKRHAADLVTLLKKSEQQVPKELLDMMPRSFGSNRNNGRDFGRKSFSGPRDRYGAPMGGSRGGFRDRNDGFRGGNKFESRGSRDDDVRRPYLRRDDGDRESSFRGDRSSKFGRRRFEDGEENGGAQFSRRRSYSAPSSWESERRGSGRRSQGGAESDSRSEGRRFASQGDGPRDARAAQSLSDEDLSPLLRRRREISSKLKDL